MKNQVQNKFNLIVTIESITPEMTTDILTGKEVETGWEKVEISYSHPIHGKIYIDYIINPSARCEGLICGIELMYHRLLKDCAKCKNELVSVSIFNNTCLNMDVFWDFLENYDSPELLSKVIKVA